MRSQRRCASGRSASVVFVLLSLMFFDALCAEPLALIELPVEHSTVGQMVTIECRLMGVTLDMSLFVEINGQAVASYPADQFLPYVYDLDSGDKTVAPSVNFNSDSDAAITVYLARDSVVVSKSHTVTVRVRGAFGPLWLWGPGTMQPIMHTYMVDSTQPRPMVLVFPGGAYHSLASHEAAPIALWLNHQGFHAAVVFYRLGPENRHPAMLQDAQRCIRLVRYYAELWHVESVVVMGFSAGGHLAASVSTLYDLKTEVKDDLAYISAKPDVAVLCYPVIDMDRFGHSDSRKMLFGEENYNDAALVELFSLQKQVHADTPPTFVWISADDAIVPMEGTLLYAAKLRAHRVPVELHVFESAPHGVGLAWGDRAVGSWKTHAIAFMRRHLFLDDDEH